MMSNPDGLQRRAAVLDASTESIALAAELIKRGALVAFPTETVYGLGADATSDAAVASIFSAKGRPYTDPLIVHAASIEQAGECGEMQAGRGDAMRLGREFWPGPLTVVVPRRPAISGHVCGGLATVGLRVPAHPVALELIRAAGRPLAAPSANRFGRVSPTTAAHVLSELGHRIDAVIDGGDTPLGVESTVVLVGDGAPRLARPGGIDVEDLLDVIPDLQVTERQVSAPGVSSEAPGALLAHYSPSVPLTLVEAGDAVVAELLAALDAEGVSAVLLALPCDPAAAAAALYSSLRSLDAAGAEVALARVLDGAGIGRAVNDRLFRAAHGHVVSECTADSVMRIKGRITGGTPA